MRLVAALLLLLAPAALAGVYTWVDSDGVTHISDDPGAVPDSARTGVVEGRDGLRDLWGEEIRGPEPVRTGAGGPVGVEEERIQRLLRTAVEDLERGEAARAAAALETVLRRDTNRPEPHWYLALLSRQRGHWDAAEAHLHAFLASAGDDLATWRESAERKLEALEDERRLADAASLPESESWVGVAHPHFRVHYDAELGRSSPDYAATALRYLEEAHRAVGDRLGVVPSEPIGVKFYGKASYLRAHRHRFSFQTVGFFDGRIHVVSAAHPAGELRALLFHEYTHAVFREQTGGDRPFWLNEGLAELSERASRSQAPLTRSERAALFQRIQEGRWLPLHRLAASFGGLDDADARAAYLVSTAAARWLELHSDRSARGRILVGLGQGRTDDEALGDALGLDTDAIDTAVQDWLRAEFPQRTLPANH